MSVARVQGAKRLLREALATTLGAAVIASQVGCGSASGPARVDGARLKNELQRALGLPLAERSREKYTAAFANVTHIYSGGEGGRSVLAVVFVAPAATGQIVGRDSPRLRGVTTARYLNAVVIYAHGDRSADATKLRASMRAAAAGG